MKDFNIEFIEGILYQSMVCRIKTCTIPLDNNDIKAAIVLTIYVDSWFDLSKLWHLCICYLVYLHACLAECCNTRMNL